MLGYLIIIWTIALGMYTIAGPIRQSKRHSKREQDETDALFYRDSFLNVFMNYKKRKYKK